MIRTAWILGWLAPLALVACVTAPPKQEDAVGKVSPQMRSGSNDLRAYQLVDWIAPDDRTLILNAMDRSLYEGRFTLEDALDIRRRNRVDKCDSHTRTERIGISGTRGAVCPAFRDRAGETGNRVGGLSGGPFPLANTSLSRSSAAIAKMPIWIRMLKP